MFIMRMITIPAINLEKLLYDTIVRSGRDPIKYTNDLVRDSLDKEIAVKRKEIKA